jgi:hypothetical protein
MQLKDAKGCTTDGKQYNIYIIYIQYCAWPPVGKVFYF